VGLPDPIAFERSRVRMMSFNAARPEGRLERLRRPLSLMRAAMNEEPLPSRTLDGADRPAPRPDYPVLVQDLQDPGMTLTDIGLARVG